MTTWNLLFLCFLPCYRASDDGVYECGTHGRFEYCIDGIPGCVVGCHCHPGYYFDTEAKICEPNSKLIQNYRRQYMVEPTRVQTPIFDPEPTNTVATLTTHNIIDEQVNDITKNADDLGDWLYNQFFKTIENQVINKTNEDNQLTRRSGHGMKTRTKSKRRARKRGKSKHKSRKKGLRRELLRITEDDSLFHSSSSSSDSDSTSSDASGSHSSSETDSDEDHRQRRIIMINKKQKPPLPSFIFLPNMDTPFYPPIGLPPPPALPMYPMVPVPPMLPAPPIIPYPAPIPECEDHETTTQSKTSTKPHVSSTVTPTTTDATITSDDSDIPTSETLPTESPNDEPPLRNRYKGRKRKKDKFLENLNNDNYNNEGELPFNFKPPLEGRQKLLQRLRQRLKHPRIKDPYKKSNRIPTDNFMNQLSPPATSMISNLNEIAPKGDDFSLDYLEDVAQPENVDFKYLSQLIHRVDGNKSQETTSEAYKPHSSMGVFNPHKQFKGRNRDLDTPLNPARRMNKQTNQPLTQRLPQPDESYYSNLGRQIASLIRTIDADNERQVNIEIEKGDEKSDTVPIFNENAPRIFWERSVRSPIKYFNPFKDKYLGNSNELLFNIENKVEIVASTTPTLSLQQIENIVKVMETAQTRIRSPSNIKNPKPSTKTLNINLWPQEIKQPKNTLLNSISSNNRNTHKKKSINYSNRTDVKKMNNEYNKIQLHKIHNFVLNTRKQENGKRINNSPFVKATSTKMYYMKNFTERSFHPTLKVNLNEETPIRSSEVHSVRRNFLNHKNIKKYFFDDSNNQNSFQNDNSPFQYSAASGTINKQVINPFPSAYFHHEINHLDYINQPSV